MKGISITGNLEKDQVILVYVIAGLIVLIVLAMITILVVLLVRRKRAAWVSLPVANSVEASVADGKFKPPHVADPLKEEKKTQEIPVKPPEKPVEKVVSVIEEKRNEGIEPQIENKESSTERVPVAFSAQKQEAVKPDEKKAEMSLEDKLAEILERMAEIKKQNPEGPSIVLPKLVAKAPEAKPVIPEEKPVELISEPVLQPENVRPEKNLLKENTVQVRFEEVEKESETIQEEIHSVSQPETDKPVQSSPFDKKDLPMKKLTFAEWVEIFK